MKSRIWYIIVVVILISLFFYGGKGGGCIPPVDETLSQARDLRAKAEEYQAEKFAEEELNPKEKEWYIWWECCSCLALWC